MSKYFYKLMSKEFFKRDIAVSLLLALIFSVFLSLAGFDVKCEQLRQNILRLHIVANSDSDEDQALKLKVRDEILKQSAGIYDGAQSKEEIALISNNNLKNFENVAKKVIAQNGKDYSVKVFLGKAYFGTREYETFTLPAGEYEALRVLIGEAKGKNWWCVMFPAMCIPAAGEEHSLNEAVDKSAAQIAENPKKYKLKFKTVEIFNSIKEKIGKVKDKKAQKLPFCYIMQYF